MNKFNSGDYILTSCGFRGYIIRQIESMNMYEIRLPSGETVRHESDLKIDDLMYQKDE